MNKKDRLENLISGLNEELLSEDAPTLRDIKLAMKDYEDKHIDLSELISYIRYRSEVKRDYMSYGRFISLG